MAIDTVPQSNTLVDGQFIQVLGPEGLITGYQYSATQKILYFKESQVIYPSFHGASHVSSDPVPDASCDLHGLMSSTDKCKLDALIGTRLGVLGFMGAGFPDDGGWMQGDVILAAGTEFISLERVGNVIRFTVDSPIPLNCSCESCAQIFWVQDETSVSAVRPPTCGGIMPGVNCYGELKVYTFPSTTIFDPNNPAAQLNNKANHPSLLFTRYTNGITPGMAEFDCILMRDSYNTLQTQIGWTMTPGTGSVPEMIWFMSKDANGKQMTFNLDADSTPGLLGGLLFNGSLITKKPAVIVGYTSTIMTTNQYTMKWWDMENRVALDDPITGGSFTATNIWMFNNPTSKPTSITPQTLVTDVNVNILPIGTIVEATYIQVGTVAGSPILHYYFSERPDNGPANLWASVGGIQFGDMLLSRLQSTSGLAGAISDQSGSISVTDARVIEPSIWGLTGANNPFTLYNMYNSEGPATQQYNYEPLAIIDYALPGMVISQPPTTRVNPSGHFSERPVFLWNRHEIGNAYVKVLMGSPKYGSFKPFDVLLGAPIDHYTDQFMYVMASGNNLQGRNWVRVKGVKWADLPSSGAIRGITIGNTYNVVFRYSAKLVWTTTPDEMDSLVLVADDSNLPYAGSYYDICELLHEDYNAPCVRIEMVPANDSANSINMQFKVGELHMDLPYEGDLPGTAEVVDYVRGMGPGYTISQVYSQPTSFSGVGTPPLSSPNNFIVYDGGAQIGGALAEYWNTLEILFLADLNQCWIFWNGLLITPSTTLSANLSTPMGVTSPYFPITSNRMVGKCGVRLWPGYSIRHIDVRAQLHAQSPFSYGQISLV